MTEPNQHSYVLRLWRDHADAPWRATLIDATEPEERRHFPTLEALDVFLRAQTGADSHVNDELRSTISRTQP
jgi:hypothetical protein